MMYKKSICKLHVIKKSTTLLSALFVLTACNQIEPVESFIAELSSANNNPEDSSIDNNKVTENILNNEADASTSTSNESSANVDSSSSNPKNQNTQATSNIVAHKPTPKIKKSLQPNTSQQFLGNDEIELRLIESLPEIPYNTDGLSEYATNVNNIRWSIKKPINSATTIKIQALLNWHNHSVGAVDGKFSKNTIKAMQTFQKSRGLKPTKKMTKMTWKLLHANNQFNQQPSLVKYTLTKKDVRLARQPGGLKNMQYRSVREKLAEKFHMTRSLLTKLNPNIRLKAGNTITVYNPGQPNTKPVYRVEVFKRKNLLVAFNDSDEIVASYPTTIGSRSPSGTYHVANRVIKPSYNSDFSNKQGVLPPGPNNPVGLVWMGLSKPSFGIHGSPKPELISRQHSHGCVRLTNWDALALYGTMQKKAKVEFKNS